MNNKLLHRIAVSFVFLSFFVSAKAVKYPETEQIQHTDEYYGVKVQDPYRWLEENVRQSQRVKDWVTAQNNLTFDYLNKLPRREQLKTRLEKLLEYDRYGNPFKRGGRYYIPIHKNTQNHPVIYKMDSLDSQKQVLFNPNDWSKDGTVALGGMSFTKDGKYVAYAVQDSGSDWQTWKIRDLQTGKDCPDTLTFLKFTAPEWEGLSKGCFYAKYPDPDTSGQFISSNKEMKVMYHQLGARQDEDVVVFYRPDHPEWNYSVQVTDDDRYLIITVWITSDHRYRVLYRDLQQPYAMPVDLIDNFENDYTFIDNDGPVFYFLTDFNAPNRRIIAIDIRKPQKENWKEIIAQSKEPLTDADVINNHFVCCYLKDVTTQTKLYSMEGQFIREIIFPGPGNADGFDGKRTDTEMFYTFQSMTTPPTVFRYDMMDGQSKVLYKNVPSDIVCEDYVTEQVFYNAKDGTRIPMFIAHKKDIKPDGSNPVLLYGYGGFNIPMHPRFSSMRLAWLEMGGIYTIANIRGGGEYGQAWHQAGMKLKKQTVFDDFIAAAEFLIAQKYTRPEKLAIYGGSNGGLLVGACMTQRPDLFAAAVPAVGVLDMLRFDEYTAGRFWTDEFGSAKDSKEMFECLLAYSPYHNLKPDIAYPATLILTADTDDRVVPAHSFKFAARLQQMQAGDKPVLIRIETRTGHGGGKPLSMSIEEQADMYAFLAENLGMK